MKGKTKYNFLSFLYSSMSGFRINLAGALGGNEILALLFSVSVKSWKKLYGEVQDLRKVIIAYGLFLMAQVISDVINGSPVNNMVRGWANIIMAIIVTNFLAKVLWRDSRNIIYYLAGSIVTILLFGELTEESMDLSKMGFFKFKLVPTLNALLLIVSWYLLYKRIISDVYLLGLFLVYGLFCFFFDSRSNGLFFVLLGSLYYWRSRLLLGITFKKAIFWLVSLAILIQGIFTVYVNQVLAGNIGGEHSRVQFSRLSNPYNPFSLLITGRSEVYVGLMAALDKPILGHGSWAEDRTGKYQYMVYKLHSAEDKFDSRFGESEGRSIIPSHSVIVGAWMTAGIIGFLAVLYVVYLFYKNGLSLLRSRVFYKNPFYLIILFYVINASWTFPFSPLGHIKKTLPVMISFVLVMNRKRLNYELNNKQSISLKQTLE